MVGGCHGSRESLQRVNEGTEHGGREEVGAEVDELVETELTLGGPGGRERGREGGREGGDREMNEGEGSKGNRKQKYSNPSHISTYMYISSYIVGTCNSS